MPSTREEHVTYTRNELNNYPYYVEIIEELKKHNIESYLDIGANVGEFCNILFEKLPTLKKAYLIEPEKENFRFLKAHVIPKNISFFEIAIGYNIPTPKIIPLHDNVGGFTIINSPDNVSNVSIKTLEELKIPKKGWTFPT
jgi:FkbM family methyltransferase